MSLEDAISRVKDGRSIIEVISVEDTQPQAPKPAIHQAPPQRIVAVLDSSFNPPTRAHLALALSSGADVQSIILLLSVRNADKQLKSGDATYAQRLHMMGLLAKGMSSILLDHTTTSYIANRTPSYVTSIAVAAIDEPTFVGKSTRLLNYLSQTPSSIVPPSHQSGAVAVRLVFIMGWDTLIRFFNPKYYPSQSEMIELLNKFFNDGEEGSSIVCARRRPSDSPNQGGSATAAAEDEEISFLASDLVKPWVEKGVVEMIDIGSDESSMSSTTIRNQIAASRGLGEWGNMTIQSVAEFIQEKSLYKG